MCRRLLCLAPPSLVRCLPTTLTLQHISPSPVPRTDLPCLRQTTVFRQPFQPSFTDSSALSLFAASSIQLHRQLIELTDSAELSVCNFPSTHELVWFCCKFSTYHQLQLCEHETNAHFCRNSHTATVFSTPVRSNSALSDDFRSRSIAISV